MLIHSENWCHYPQTMKFHLAPTTAASIEYLVLVHIIPSLSNCSSLKKRKWQKEKLIEIYQFTGAGVMSDRAVFALHVAD